MNEDEQIIWGQPVSFEQFVGGFNNPQANQAVINLNEQAARERYLKQQEQKNSEIVRVHTPEGKTSTSPQIIGMSGTDPVGQFLVEGVALGPAFKLAGKGVLYGLGRYGSVAAQNWARAKVISGAIDSTTPKFGIPIFNVESSTIPYSQSQQLFPKTSLKFFERPQSKISLTEKMGIPKGERNNLNQFQKEALTDLDQYIKSGQYRQYPTINMDTAEPFWGTKYGNEPAIKQLIQDGVPSVRGRGQEWQWNRPNGGTYDLVTDGQGNFGIGYSSYGMFDVSPEFNVRVGEASAGSAKNGYSKIFLTAPKNDAIHFITETPEQEIAKKALIETQSPRINKTIMKDFWSGVQQSLKPGAYLSGDEGTLPKGATLIRQFKELSKGAYKRDNSGKIIGSGRTNWEDIRNSLMKPEKWKRREDGLSTDSYLALLKQAKRENSPYYLRYSPDGFTTFNSQSIDNKFISDLLEKTKTGEATQQEFLKAFHDWVSPYNGIDAKIVNNEIVIPHPFLYKKKKGGKFRK